MYTDCVRGIDAGQIPGIPTGMRHLKHLDINWGQVIKFDWTWYTGSIIFDQIWLDQIWCHYLIVTAGHAFTSRDDVARHRIRSYILLTFVGSHNDSISAVI